MACFSNAIATCALLLSRHVIKSEEDAGCPFCKQHTEDLLHLFCTCYLAKEVWAKVSVWLGLQHSPSANIVDHFLSFGSMFSGKVSKQDTLIGLQLVGVLGLLETTYFLNGRSLV